MQIAANLVGGAIRGNEIQGTTLGVDYAAAADLSGNRIHGSAVGVRVAARRPRPAVGLRGCLSSRMQSLPTRRASTCWATCAGQIVRDNVTGVTGSGILGPDTLDEANLIQDNTTGVDFSGTIQFNRFADNATGIKAKGNSQIVHNVVTSSADRWASRSAT